MYSPKFSITNSILTNIARIEAAKELIENAPLVPAWEQQFRQEALYRTVHHGTHIEGNQLNFTQAKEILQGRKIPARDRDVQEVINYRNVIKYIDQVQQSIDEQIILNIHRLTTEKVLPPEQVGKYRQVQVVVKNSKTGQISFTPPAADQIEQQIKDFLLWLGSQLAYEVHPVLRAGVVHYQLARIHPFVDGNGRVARSVATLSLFLDQYDIKKFFSLEEFFDHDAPAYYLALQQVSNQQVESESDRDLTAWLEYFTRGLAEELARVKEKVQKLSSDIKLKNKVGQIALSARQAKIMEYVQDYGKITNQEWRNLFPNISDDTILRDLKDLKKKKLIRKKGKTKAAVYILR